MKNYSREFWAVYNRLNNEYSKKLDLVHEEIERYGAAREETMKEYKDAIRRMDEFAVSAKGGVA